MSYKRSRAAFESEQQAPPHHAPFALYGTPLPALEAGARDDGSFVPEWKQTVTDERGRKRLHGAFTGGWSAGYGEPEGSEPCDIDGDQLTLYRHFNTVGSKEGWTPSAFVSSRTNRAKDQKDGKQREQRPEDFMDEEDLAEQAESQKLETQHAFAGLGSVSDANSDRGMFADLFRTTGETMGVKLLQRMGWKQGQGVGPKVRRRVKGDEKGELHSFAPDNSRMVRIVRKLDQKGLGFAGEAQLHGNSGFVTANASDDDNSGDDARILQTNRSKILAKPKPLKKGAFGVGVLNDTGSDDDDPYSVGPRIKYSRTVGSDKKRKKSGLTAKTVDKVAAKPIAASKTLAQPLAALAGFRKSHDGRLPLDGFILSIASLHISQENEHPPPIVPEGWKPSKRASLVHDLNMTYQSTADAAKASSLDPKSRAALLGEQQLPGKSIFDFLSPATRDRLASASGKTNLPPGLGESAPDGFEPNEATQRRTLWDLVPVLSKETATAALQRGASGWMPYEEDHDKRTRYRIFLELSAGSRTDLPPRMAGASADEWAKELREFADAAEIFKPVSGLMASRFTTSSSSVPKLASDMPDTHPRAAVEKEEDPAEKAARMGMYGPLTRSYFSFSPPRLLCKRFGVKPPPGVSVDPSSDAGGEGETVREDRRLDLVSQSSLDRMMLEANVNKSLNTASGDQSRSAVNSDEVLVRAPPAEVDAEKNEALEAQHAPGELFKAIFGSDDEDD